MKRSSLTGVVGATLLLALPLVAAGQTWSSYRAAFPMFPCSDGWAGCIVEGQRVGQGVDALPADLRVDWFTLGATATFSPFAGLSTYTGDSQASGERVPNVVERPPSNPKEPEPVAVQPVPRPAQPVQRPVRPVPPRPARPVPPPVSPVQPVRVAKDPGGTGDESGCGDLIALETPAMLGQLEKDSRACLEGRIAGSDKQTTKLHASMILIQNAWGAGQRGQWEKLVLRHLEEIDRSDPALCYKLALHLEEQGPPRAAEVIRWADLSMSNARRVWSDEDYTDKMYSLHRLKSKAASELWYVAEEHHTSNPTPDSRQAAEKYRGQAKNYSKEWYLFAKRVGKDTTHPREMCLSAAGTSDFCEDA
ncbi:MAG: hypothetical protein AAGA48_06955 [Myxococcota bacterium]